MIPEPVFIVAVVLGFFVFVFLGLGVCCCYCLVRRSESYSYVPIKGEHSEIFLSVPWPIVGH